MKILDPLEQEAFDRPPAFNAAERKQFFDLPMALWDIAYSLRTPLSQIGFVLACGYFKTAKRFFKPDDFHQRDIEYVARQLDSCATDFIPQGYEPRLRQRHANQILNFYGYKRFTKEAEQALVIEINIMIRDQLKPKLVFWRCVDVLIRKNIQIPKAYQLSVLILRALNARKKELSELIDQALTPETRDLLDGLFMREGEDQYARYKLTLLKKRSQSTAPTQIKERAADLLYLAQLHTSLAPLLPVLNLGHEGIHYFANSVIKSDIFQLSQRAPQDRYIHVVSFIVHQYYRLQDNLVDTFLTTVRSFHNTVQRLHKEWCYEQHKAQQQALKSLTETVDTHVFTLLQTIQEISHDPQIDDSDTLGKLLAGQ